MVVASIPNTELIIPVTTYTASSRDDLKQVVLRSHAITLF